MNVPRLFKFIASLICLLPIQLYAQEEMLQLLKKDTTTVKTVAATFKTSHIINLQSNETVKGKSLDLRISHRFGAIGAATSGSSSIHNLWGFDEINDVRIAFEYGVTDNFTIGFSRTKYRENWEMLGKCRLLKQTKDNHLPIAITVFSNIAYSTKPDERLLFDLPGKAKEFERRISYTAELIFAKKFSKNFSLELVPGMVHHNFIVEADGDNNSLYFVGIGGRVKITRFMAIVGDYVYNFNERRLPGNKFGYYNPLGAGLEIETGGHVFSLMFTNAFAILENEYISQTVDTWTKGGMRFSFTISRAFNFKPKPILP